ncbi:hypothetical protein BJY01DRAFT_161367 [Aspergillus pseudoustus]|uniref:Uncharacterized protein n=1 Tax=Aspergillus pseudoustus TaxID=1810923 RepID=A0ABR4K787_9EURO
MDPDAESQRDESCERRICHADSFGGRLLLQAVTMDPCGAWTLGSGFSQFWSDRSGTVKDFELSRPRWRTQINPIYHSQEAGYDKQRGLLANCGCTTADRRTESPRKSRNAIFLVKLLEGEDRGKREKRRPTRRPSARFHKFSLPKLAVSPAVRTTVVVSAQTLGCSSSLLTGSSTEYAIANRSGIQEEGICGSSLRR